jgi:dihydrodipicolinate synthase/N-acetylneuraminate lyase
MILLSNLCPCLALAEAARCTWDAMNTSPLLVEEFATSVLAVPPLARRADLSLDPAQNQRLIRHIEAGGHRILLYGGNANLYHCGLPDYAQMLDLLAAGTLDSTRVIPAVGPDFGRLMEQARLLRGTGYRTAMVLPMQGFTSPEGMADGIRRFVDAAGIPVTLYLKSEQTIDIARIGTLVDEGSILVIKYAVVREDPARDAYLEALVQRIGAARIVSGMGERPAPVHMARFGVASFTTGCGCIAPRACMQLLRALQRGDGAMAEKIHARFMPLENLRESISLIRVLHDAVTLSGVADMGAQLPLLSASPAERMDEIRTLALDLLAFEQQQALQ